MKTVLLILFCALTGFLAAQSVSIKVDKMPEYPGGNKALVKLQMDSVEDPGVKWEEANDDDVKIVITCMIDEQGRVSDVQVVKSTNKVLDAKLVRLVKKLKFIPAMLDGKPVKVKYTLPFLVDFGDRTKY